LKGIDAIFPPAAITALVGPSGSGKSSLLRILACVDRPTAGQVFVGSKEISAMSRAKRRSVRRGLGRYMFQRPADNLISYLTAAEHLEMAAKLRGADRSGEAEELLDVLHLRGRANHRPSQLSGGEQQRLALASAVIGGPALVVADEPTPELDSAPREALIGMIGPLPHPGPTFPLPPHDPTHTN